jgi:hypothetical protein
MHDMGRAPARVSGGAALGLVAVLCLMGRSWRRQKVPKRHRTDTGRTGGRRDESAFTEDRAYIPNSQISKSTPRAQSPNPSFFLFFLFEPQTPNPNYKISSPYSHPITHDQKPRDPLPVSHLDVAKWTSRLDGDSRGRCGLDREDLSGDCRGRAHIGNTGCLDAATSTGVACGLVIARFDEVWGEALSAFGGGCHSRREAGRPSYGNGDDTTTDNPPIFGDNDGGRSDFAREILITLQKTSRSVVLQSSFTAVLVAVVGVFGGNSHDGEGEEDDDGSEHCWSLKWLVE